MRPMFARRRSARALALFGFGVAVLVFLADQASKWWILNIVDLDTVMRVRVLDPVFNLSMVWNQGVSFGLFQAGNWWQRGLLIAVSLGVSGFLAVWMLSAERRLQAAAFGLIIGGALGNVIDRFAFGAVVDFLDFSGLYFPFVFNIADAAISIGVAVLILDLLIHGERKK